MEHGNNDNDGATAPSQAPNDAARVPPVRANDTTEPYRNEHDRLLLRFLRLPHV